MAEYKSKHTGAEIDAGIDKANAALPLNGGEMTGDLILNGDPSSDNAATNKRYVDSKIPKTLPNPNALTFKGAASGTYDGSAPLEITIPEGGSGGVSSWNDLTDKPFGDEEKEDFIIPETTAEFVNGNPYYPTNPPVAPWVLGRSYTVVWNGTSYTCTANEFPVADVPMYALGNASMVGGEDTGEPFLIAASNERIDGVYGIVIDLTGGTSAIFSVYGLGLFTEKIPEKYIPEIKTENVFYAELSLYNPDYSGTGLVGMLTNSNSSVRVAVNDGKLVYIRDVDSGRILGTYCGQTYLNDDDQRPWFIGCDNECVYLYEVSGDGTVTRHVISKGNDGEDGYTPVKGVDYWTEADQESIVQQVIKTLGTPLFGKVDADNNIVLYGTLTDGTYTVKYEDAEGNVTDIGDIDIGGGVTNRIPLSINADGTLYNGGKGWKTGYRLNSSGAEAAATGMEVVGFIPFTLGDVAYFANMTLIVGNSAAQASNQYIVFYDAAFAKIGTTKFTDAMLQSASTTYTADESGNLKSLALDHGIFNFMGVGNQSGNAKYFRISAEEINDNSIITLNEPIA